MFTINIINSITPNYGCVVPNRVGVRKAYPNLPGFPGFTHYYSRSRNGKRFRMKRKTISKRLTAKLKAYKAWLKSNRTLTTPEIIQKTVSKLRGHYGYYGVTDNSKGISAYFYEVRGILYKWLNRRGKQGCYSWEKFAKLIARYPLPTPRIMVNLF